ncbi:hypothetical protein AYJ58_13065 [Shewanella sp. Pdp11]|nr:hypothetical protein AYJ58_13065 [Shewanella sp. Pdp11]
MKFLILIFLTAKKKKWIDKNRRVVYEWRSSKTPGIQQALSNEYLKKTGLCSLRDGWIAVHYPNQNV